MLFSLLSIDPIDKRHLYEAPLLQQFEKVNLMPILFFLNPSKLFIHVTTAHFAFSNEARNYKSENITGIRLR